MWLSRSGNRMFAVAALLTLLGLASAKDLLSTPHPPQATDADEGSQVGSSARSLEQAANGRVLHRHSKEKEEKEEKEKIILFAGVFGGMIVLGIFVCCLFTCCCKPKKKDKKDETADGEKSTGIECTPQVSSVMPKKRRKKKRKSGFKNRKRVFYKRRRWLRRRRGENGSSHESEVSEGKYSAAITFELV